MYTKMPMGLSISADIFQREMTKLMEGLDYVLVYIDDLLVITKGDFDDHLEKLREVLLRLREKGIKLNALKTFFAAHEVDYLGYVINWDGFRPQEDKVKAIRNMSIPKTMTHLRGFVGLVNFYRDSWQRRADTITPLTNLISKKKGAIKWTKEANDAFIKTKEMCAKDALLYFPNYKKPFEIHTDSSDYQMGAIISQDKKVVAYWSKKLSSAQKNYPIIEKELLAIVEVLKEFKNMLLGHELIIWTDHKNLTYENTKFTCERVLRQRLKLEEYGPTIKFIDGTNNIAADMMSRIPQKEEEKLQFLDSYAIEQLNADTDNEIRLMNLRPPICYERLHSVQATDEELHKLRTDKKTSETMKLMHFGHVRTT